MRSNSGRNVSGFIPGFKLRAAYGQAGIQPGAFDRYPTLSSRQLGSDLSYSNNAAQKNPDLGVEVSSETEYGTDINFILSIRAAGSELLTFLSLIG
jgi:hypothetical protein